MECKRIIRNVKPFLAFFFLPDFWPGNICAGAIETIVELNRSAA
jgi:hypothetical protein